MKWALAVALLLLAFAMAAFADGSGIPPVTADGSGIPPVTTGQPPTGNIAA